MINREEKRIAMLSVHSCPLGKIGERDTGGMSVYLRELSRELEKQGFLIDIFTRRQCKEHPYLVNLGKNIRLIHLKAGPEKHLEKLQIYQHLNEFKYHLESFRQEFDLRYEVIFSHYWLSGCVAKSIQQWWNIPHVIMFHTLGALKNNFKVGKPEPRLRIETEKLLAKKCQNIIAPTEQEKKHLICSYGTASEKIKVIPCGVNLQLFRPLDKYESRLRLGFNDEKIILFVGRIDPIKGIDTLIKSIPYLKEKQKLRLVIIGDDAHSQLLLIKLKKLVDSLQLKGKIIFKGIVPQEQLPYYYSAADVCSVVSYYESFGLVALEALACGTPVVARNVGILDQLIKQGKNGWVLKTHHSPEELAEKLAFFLSRNNRVSASHCRDTVMPFGWKNIAEQMKQVLLNLPQPSTVPCLSS